VNATAQLPALDQPSIIPLTAVLGGFLASVYTRLRGWTFNEIKDAALEGAFWGTAVGVALYLVALLLALP